MRVLFIGDSLVQGYLDPSMRGWPGRVAARLINEGQLDPAATLYNLGIRGNNGPAMAARWKAETAVRLADEPVVLCFCFGTADTKQLIPLEQSLAAAEQMLGEARKLGPTLFMTPPPVSDAEVTGRIRTLSEALIKLCDGLGMPCFDLFSRLLASDPYMQSLTRSDQVHPDEQGYALMADIILTWDDLRQALRGE